MKIWVDDVIPAPEDYVWCKSVSETIEIILEGEKTAIFSKISGKFDNMVRHWPTLIDIGYDAGDYIKILDWLEEMGRSYPIRIHRANQAGIENMRRIIERNGWEEVK